MCGLDRVLLELQLAVAGRAKAHVGLGQPNLLVLTVATDAQLRPQGRAHLCEARFQKSMRWVVVIRAFVTVQAHRVVDSLEHKGRVDLTPAQPVVELGLHLLAQGAWRVPMAVTALQVFVARVVVVVRNHVRQPRQEPEARQKRQDRANLVSIGLPAPAYGGLGDGQEELLNMDATALDARLLQPVTHRAHVGWRSAKNVTGIGKARHRRRHILVCDVAIDVVGAACHREAWTLLYQCLVFFAKDLVGPGARAVVQVKTCSRGALRQQRPRHGDADAADHAHRLRA